MTTMNLNEAKANLSRLVDAAAAGEEIIIAKGRVTDAFFQPLSEQELSAWEM